MNDLHALLDRAAGSPSDPADTVDSAADLTRGHRALTRTRRRRGAAGLAGVAAVGVLGVALTGRGDSRAPDRIADRPSVVPAPEPSAPTVPPPSADATDPTELPTLPTETIGGDPSAPVTGSADPTFFAVPAAPAGWEVQGSSPFGVTYARPGDPTVPENFENKIVLMFEANPPSGEKYVVGDRVVWEDPGGGEYATVSVRPRAGEPRGLLVLQYPAGTLELDEAVAFVTAVRVRDGAVAVAG